jgi:hypothetical protein
MPVDRLLVRSMTIGQWKVENPAFRFELIRVEESLKTNELVHCLAQENYEAGL